MSRRPDARHPGGRRPNPSRGAAPPPDPAPDPAAERRDTVQMRLAGVVIAVAMTGWIALQWLARRLGWADSTAILIDLSAIAAFVWSLLVTWRVWRRRRPA